MREIKGLGARQRAVLDFLETAGEPPYTLAELVQLTQGVEPNKQNMEVMRETVRRLADRGLVLMSKETVIRKPAPPQQVWLVRAA